MSENTNKEENMGKSDLDFKELGFKSGIEIHQQLKGNKLFCDCPAVIVDKEPEMQVKRTLKAVVGETGEIDQAAAHETKKNKYYLYDYHRCSCCMVDLDEEPPHDIDEDALKASLVTSRLLNAKIVDEIQVMRKTVVDGSNTTGFQRTALVSLNGSFDIETDGDKTHVTIPNISIEEDSAKIVDRNGKFDNFNLSRLGIPLIEIGTNPDLKTPEQVKKAAEYIGMVLRSLPNCARGLGTTRQDVNVSIAGGSRVEIKGAQNLKELDILATNEVIRQKYMLGLKDRLNAIYKEGDLDGKKKELVDVTDVFSLTKSNIIKSALDKKEVILGVKLDGLRGEFGSDVQPGKRLGRDIADYVKVKTPLKGLIHFDETPNKLVTEEEKDKVMESLRLGKDDGFVLIVADDNLAREGLSCVLERLDMLRCGVPSEVRKANQDNTTTYMRPMPGHARMYPETDVMPVNVKDVEYILPELMIDRIERYKKDFDLKDDLAKQLVRRGNFELFEQIVELSSKENNNEIKFSYIAELIVSYENALEKEFKIKEESILNVTDKSIIDVMSALLKKEIAKDSVMGALVDIAKGQGFDASNYKMVSDDELKAGIKDIIEKNQGAPMGALMGQVMAKFKGKADGKKISQLVREMSQ